MDVSRVSSFLPSKRVGSLLLIVGALIVAVLIIRGDNDTQNETTPEPVAARLTAERTILTESDTDGDGLKDWVEGLWGLSSVSADTDGDGIGDKDDLEATRKAEEEERTAAFLQSYASFASSSNDLTATDKLSRALFEQLFAFRSAGISIDENVTNQVSGALNTNIFDGARPTAEFVTSDKLTIITAASDAEIRIYGNRVGDIMKGPSTEATNELFVFAQFGEANDPAVLLKLLPVANHYETLADELTSVTVPMEIAQAHLDLINSMRQVAVSLRGTATLSTDSLNAILSLQSYAQSSAIFVDATKRIRLYLEDYRDIFSETDPAMIILNLENETPA